jgi:hypothetical protein
VLPVQLHQEQDMIWDDGTRNVEPVMDIYAADHIGLVRIEQSVQQHDLHEVLGCECAPLRL